jgi:hypothetical protein
MLDPGALEGAPWMSLTEAAAILKPLIRNGEHLQALLYAIERGEIEMRIATQNDGVILLPAGANRHLKPADVDWAKSSVFVKSILLKPSAYASDDLLPVRISRDDFLDRFKAILGAVEQQPRDGDHRKTLKPKPHRPSGTGYAKSDDEIIKKMKEETDRTNATPSAAFDRLHKDAEIRPAGNSTPESQKRRLVRRFKETYGNGE